MTITLISIIAIIVLWVIFSYNGFIHLMARTGEAWADIDVQLKRRYDLIPNLVETVKGYAKHEKETLDAVITARNNATQVHASSEGISDLAIREMSAAEAGLGSALGKLFALSEEYPDLKANHNFLELQKELSDTENKIQASRRFYNTNVRDLNIKIDTFPSNLVARFFHFSKRTFFDLEGASSERNLVGVKF